MDKEYITIKEYADVRGVSVSSVYKRLNTTLKEYLVVVENRKMLKSEVLAAEGLKGRVEEDSTVNVQPSSTSSTPNVQPSSTSSTLLEKQLEAKDKQIEALTEQIKSLQESNQKKDDFIQEQSAKLTELLEQSNVLLRNNQMLLADKKGSNEEDNIKEADIVSTEVDDPPGEDKEEPKEEKKEEKKGFFRRLFG